MMDEKIFLEFEKLSKEFIVKNNVSIVTILSIYISLAVTGCASANLSDEDFRGLLLEMGKDFKRIKTKIQEELKNV